jgi:shikimate kinase
MNNARPALERILLIGLSGAGKTSVAHALGPRLGWQVADSDAWIVHHTGRSIADWFAEEGETAFRAVEHAALVALCQQSHLVIATGGGVVTVERNWQIMQQASRIVWLRASEPAIVERLLRQRQADPGAVRPLLEGDLVARIHRLTTERAALYARADVIIDTDGLSIERIADAIMADPAVRHVVSSVARASGGEPT